jgi:CheY-like chemotaxis protein
MLREPSLTREALAEGVKTIERAARAQQQLVDDLLDVSRIVSGKLRISVRPTRLHTAIEAALDAVRPAADARSVKLESHVSPDVGTVRADPDRVQQIVWNLLSNAVKFTPSGGRARLEAYREGTEVIIKVTDTGIGIVADFIPQLFDRFKQAHVGTTREQAGLGLGLAIARQLVELHGGTLTGTSDGEGQGSTFIVRLPLPAVRGDVADTASAEHEAGSLAGRQILLVEDDEVSRDAINAFLKSEGADVTAVDSARAALDVLSQQRFGMMVADIAMPGMDGYELMRQVRAQEKQEQRTATPALALSAFARQEDQRRATEAGFHAYLVKPVESDRLIAVLNGLMRKA